jgi:hypothetical protein
MYTTKLSAGLPNLVRLSLYIQVPVLFKLTVDGGFIVYLPKDNLLKFLVESR